jgi:CubicO group peptidase (beta-lactamase class C family)
MRYHIHTSSKKLLFFIIGVAFAASCSSAPIKPTSISLGDYEYTKRYVSWLIQKEMKKNDITGLSIALVDDQRIVWTLGFGYADKANKVPAAPETLYRVGSISKLFTATAVMQLVEEGKLDIDKSLQTYLPEFSIKTRFPDAAPVTPRSIMTHHSGLPSDFVKGMWSKNAEPFSTVLDHLKDEYVANPPNFVFSYSNLGVTILGHAVEKVSGREFVSYMDDAVLRPMNMAHSSFAPGPDLKQFLSKGYRDGKETEEAWLRDVPAGALQSNVLDLSKFMEMVFAQGKSGEHKILEPETLAEMLRVQNADIPLDLNFRIGLGWMLSGLGNIDIKNAGPVANHGGATLLFRSQLIILPEHKLGVVVLANSFTSGNTVGNVAVEAIKLALEAKTGIKQPEVKKPADSGTSLTSKDLQAYPGKYATIMGVARVIKKSDYLQAEFMDRTFRLVPRSDGQLGLQYKLFGFIPISLGKLDNVGISRASIMGHDVLIARLGEQELLVGEKINPTTISETWRKRAGEYEIVNQGEDIVAIDKPRLSYDGGLLLVEFAIPFFSKKISRFALTPVSDDEAIICGLGRGMGETIKVIMIDGKEGLQYSGYQFKRKAK